MVTWATQLGFTIPNSLRRASLLIDSLSDTHIDIRKAFLTACRVQQLTRTNILLKEEFSPHKEKVVRMTVVNDDPDLGLHRGDIREIKVSTLMDIFDTEFLGHQVLLSYLSMSLRCMPYNDFSCVLQTIEDGIRKEISDSVDIPIAQVLDYRPLFDSSFIGASIHPLIPASENVHRTLQHGWARVAERMSRKILLPKYSWKSTSTQTERNYFAHSKIEFGVIPYTKIRQISTADLLIRYAETGYQTPGPEEVRWGWKYNDLKPRIYFAQGGTAFFTSMYIQQIVNECSEILASTSPRTRFHLQRLVPQDVDPEHWLGKRFMIHDFASFTSRMCEIKYFMKALGTRFLGTMIRVVDPYEGLIQLDMGEYILQYVETNMENPSFSLERIWTEEKDNILQHTMAGMLGVYGNIVSCTILHGIVLSDLADGDAHSTVVGDDGAAYVHPRMEFKDVQTGLELIGTIHFRKFGKWILNIANEMHGRHFLKRPLMFKDGIMSQDFLRDFPFLLTIAFSESQLSKDPHTQAYPTEFEKARAFILQLTRFLDRIVSQTISPVEMEFMARIFEACYKRLGLPVSGSLPPHTLRLEDEKFPFSVPAILEVETYTTGWLDYLYKTSRHATVRLPEFKGYGRDQYVGPLRGLVPPSVVFTTTRKGVSILELLDYISTEPVMAVYALDDITLDLHKRWLRGDRSLKRIYRIHIEKDLPVWYSDVEEILEDETGDEANVPLTIPSDDEDSDDVSDFE